jgi:hypothetical protein
MAIDRTVHHPVFDPRGEGIQPIAAYLWNKGEERSLPNILPEDFMRLVDRTWQNDPQLFDPDERKLRERLAEAKRRPTPLTNRLRMKFWHEYDCAQAEQRMMKLVNVYNGICFHEHFYQYMRDIHNLAWVMCPPANYLVVMEEALAFGIEQLRDILDEPMVDPKTKKFNTTLADTKVKIVAMLDQRVKGAVVQRVEQTTKQMNLNVSVKTSADKVAKLATENTAAQLEARLAAVQSRNKAVLPADFKQYAEEKKEE